VNADRENETLYSNRAASYSALNMHAEALADADKCIQLKPQWVKGHFRRGIALVKLGRSGPLGGRAWGGGRSSSHLAPCPLHRHSPSASTEGNAEGCSMS